MNRSETISKLTTALVEAQKEIMPANKTGLNPHFGNKFADISEIIDTVKPALLKHGITPLQVINGTKESTVIETLLVHISGEYIGGEMPVVVAKQNDPQALGSGLTYAKRYALQALLVVATKDEDDDGEKAMNRTTTAKTTTYTKPATTNGKAVMSEDDYSDLPF